MDVRLPRCLGVSPDSPVAVLACGIDRPYPRGHEGLIAQIARTVR
jgi:predicted Rossmann fold nucleotide-binding protein DprA/Smf involved in DNA uptake